MGRFVILAAASVAACGWGYPDARAERAKARGHADAPEAQVLLSGGDCSDANGDSAQAVCVATHPENPEAPARRVFDVVRRGDTICVTTGPGDPMTLDDMGRTVVVRGRVLENVRSDSIGCR